MAAVSPQEFLVLREEVESLKTELGSIVGRLGAVTQQQLEDRARFEDATSVQVITIKEDMKTIVTEAQKTFEQQRMDLGELLARTTAEAVQGREEAGRLQGELQRLHGEAAAGWERHEEKLNGIVNAAGRSFMEIQKKLENMEAER